MKPHTSSFKNEIAKFGRQIQTGASFYKNTNIVSETSRLSNIITEDGYEIVTEIDQTPGAQVIQYIPIFEENIYSVDIINNGSLLKSLMKQCNIEIKESTDFGSIYNPPLGSIFAPSLGVLVNNSYQGINFGDFIIYSKEYNVENDTWQYIAYDKMLWSMKKYNRLNVSYPITIKNYLSAIARKMGVPFAGGTFVNYDKLIYKDYFAGKDVTYRDILDKLSEITASNIIIDKYGLTVKYPTETNDAINETNIKDTNVNFGKQFGPINNVEFIDKENNLYVSAKDNESIETNGENKITITNNPFIFNGEEEEICKNILNQLKQVSYSINDFKTTGICYYDFLDIFTVSLNNTNYKCLLLNNEIKIQQGIEETIFTEELKNTQSEVNNYVNSSISNNDTQNNIEQLNADKVSRSNVINAINESKEPRIINSSKMFIVKELTATTDSNGFIDVGLDGNYVVLCGTALFDNANEGFIIPYYTYENDNYKWYLKIEDKNKTAITNTTLFITIYYFKKPI